MTCESEHSILVTLIIISFVGSSTSCPDFCSCVDESVQCYGQGLQDIPEGIPANTEHLDLQNNDIAVIKGDRLQHLANLSELLLSYNQISKIEPGTFSGLTRLELLNMDSNIVSELVPEAFAGLDSLSSLHLTNNKITTVDAAFKNMTKLTRLDIGGNKISTLSSDIFEDLKNLIYLMIPDNDLEDIPSETFTPLQSLSYLVMKNNPIGSADKLFLRNHRLSYIDLTGCQLNAIPKGLPWATRYLQMSNNNVTRVKKDAFIGTRYLTIVVLDENRIDKIEKGAFNQGRSLKEVWLNANLLKKIPSPLSPKVTKLYLAKNQITTITSKNFPKNSALKILTFSGNKIETIDPSTFSQLKLLTDLHLNNNQLTSLKANSFSGLNKLKTLSLNSNKFTMIEDGAFNGLASLQRLEMAFIVDIDTTIKGNPFASTPNLDTLDLQLSPSLTYQIVNSQPMLSAMVNLTSVNLMDNALTTLSSDVKTFLPSIEMVKLAGNRWHCDKRLQWLSAWIRANKKVFFMYRNIQCYTPRSLRELPVSLLRPSQFAPVTSTTQASVTTTSSSSTTRSPTTTRKRQKTSTFRPATYPRKTRKQTRAPMPPVQTRIITKKQTVIITQRFFVYPSTSPRSVDRKTSIRTDSITKVYKPDTTKSASSLTPAQPTRTRYTDQMTTDMTQSQSTIQPKIISTRLQTSGQEEMTSQKKKPSTDVYRNSTGGLHDLVPQNDTTGNSKVQPGHSENVSASNPNHRELLSSDPQRQTIIIATCVTIAVFVLIIVVVAFFVYRYRQNKLVYHRAFQYRQDYSDVTFFVGEPSQEMIDTKPRTSRSRSDRGSTSSRPSEDITNDLDTSMKVYTLDDE